MSQLRVIVREGGRIIEDRMVPYNQAHSYAESMRRRGYDAGVYAN